MPEEVARPSAQSVSQVMRSENFEPMKKTAAVWRYSKLKISTVEEDNMSVRIWCTAFHLCVL